MAKDAIVSEDLARKFATEKETPYTRWIGREGLDIISAHYVPNLHTVELALAYFPRIVGLRDGRVLFDLAPDKVTDELLGELYAGHGDAEVPFERMPGDKNPYGTACRPLRGFTR